MGITKREGIFIYFLIAILLSLIGYYFSVGNFEFVYYGVLTLLISVPFTLYLIKKLRLPFSLILGIGFLIVINMFAGGIIFVKGTRLYDWIVIPIFSLTSELSIIKFDQVVHAYGGFIVTLVIYYILRFQDSKNSYGAPIFGLVLLLAGFGAASFYEIVEFFSKAFESNGVGEYYNTLLDLCSNFLGALVAIFILRKREFKSSSKGRYTP